MSDHFTRLIAQNSQHLQPLDAQEHACPVCQSVYDTVFEAEDCCGIGGEACCPVCLNYANSIEAAVDCCLHMHPKLTHAARQRIAQAVKNGATWLDAVKANEQ